MAKAASAEITISPKTDTAVMNVEIASPRGKLVNCQACSKPSNEKGTGREKAWPSTACAVEGQARSEEHTSELQSRGHLVCRLLLEKKKTKLTRNDTKT